MAACRILLALFLLVAVGLVFVNAGAPDPKVIHEQIKVVKAEEKATLKGVHDWYTQFIKRDRLDEAVLELERTVLRAQETALLNVATADADRKRIRAHFDSLVGMLKIGSRLDEVQIAQLKLTREAHENYVRNAYRARIAFLENLEAQARAAAKAKGNPKKR